MTEFEESLSPEQKTALRRSEDWNRRRLEASNQYVLNRGFTTHPLLDNDEVEIVLAEAFKAGAVWAKENPC